MVLTLNAQGQVINGAGEVVPEAEVKQKLEQILGANPGQAFTIQGDQATPYQHVLKLYEMVQGLGGKSVGLEGFK